MKTVLSLCYSERREVIVDAKRCADPIFRQPDSGSCWNLCNGLRNKLSVVLIVLAVGQVL